MSMVDGCLEECMFQNQRERERDREKKREKTSRTTNDDVVCKLNDFSHAYVPRRLQTCCTASPVLAMLNQVTAMSVD